jgi:hypothetical protein
MATSLINTECKRYGCMKNLLACYANCRYNSRCDDLRNEILPNLEQAAGDINAYRRERELSAIEIQLMKRGLKFVDVAALQKNLAQGKKRKLKSPLKSRAKIITAKPQPPAENAKPEAPQRKVRQSVKKTKIKAASRLQKTPAIAQKWSEPLVVKRTLAPLQESGENKTLKRQVVLQEKPRTRPKKRARVKSKKPIMKSETGLKMAKNIKDSETKNAMVTTDSAPANLMSASERAAVPRRKKSPSQDAAAKKKKRMFIILDGERSALVDERGLMAKLLAGVSPNARYFEATEIELRLQIAHKK